MPPLNLVVLAGIAMASLATLRLVRVHIGRSPLPEGLGRLPFMAAFVVVPPLALAALTQPAAAAGLLRGVSSVPIYFVIVLMLVSLMAVTALIVGLFARNRFGQLVKLALVGSEGDAGGVRADAPLSAELAESIRTVDRANAAFPRGPEFARQIDRPGFRSEWDTLDEATRTLEARIVDDYRLDKGVAYQAIDTAKDARSRLDTLRRFAVEHDQDWSA